MQRTYTLLLCFFWLHLSLLQTSGSQLLLQEITARVAETGPVLSIPQCKTPAPTCEEVGASLTQSPVLPLRDFTAFSAHPFRKVSLTGAAAFPGVRGLTVQPGWCWATRYCGQRVFWGFLEQSRGFHLHGSPPC